MMPDRRRKGDGGHRAKTKKITVFGVKRKTKLVENEKIAHGARVLVLSGRGGGVGIGRVVGDYRGESTSGRRTTNGPVVRGRTNMYCA